VKKEKRKRGKVKRKEKLEGLKALME